MGLGPMFFLNLLGGAGKRYSERKAEEREKQRRLDEMQKEQQYALDRIRESHNLDTIAKQAEKIEEEAQKNKEYRDRLSQVGYTKPYLEKIMATTGYMSKDAAIANAEYLKKQGLEADDAYNIIPILTGSPIHEPLANAPILTKIVENKKAFKEATGENASSYAIEHSTLTQQIFELPDGAEKSNLIEMRTELENQMKRVAQAKITETGKSPYSISDKRQIINSVLVGNLKKIATVDPLTNRITAIREGTENKVLDNTKNALQSLSQMSTNLFVENTDFVTLIKAQEDIYYDTLQTRAPFMTAVNGFEAFTEGNTNPTNAFPRDIRRNISLSGSTETGLEDFVYINAPQNTATFKNTVEGELNALIKNNTIKENSVVSTVAYITDDTGKITGFKTGSYNYYFYTGKKLHELPYNKVRRFY